MKWINKEGVKFNRGDYEGLMAKFDNWDVWFCMRAMATQQTQKSAFKSLGEYLGATSCEVRYMWDEEGNARENNVVAFMSCTTEYLFYVDTPDGLKRIEI